MPDARDVRIWRTEDRRRHQSLADEDDISTSIKAHLKSPFKVVMRQEGLVEKIQCEMTKEESERQDRTVQEFKPAFKDDGDFHLRRVRDPLHPRQAARDCRP